MADIRCHDRSVYCDAGTSARAQSSSTGASTPRAPEGEVSDSRSTTSYQTRNAALQRASDAVRSQFRGFSPLSARSDFSGPAREVFRRVRQPDGDALNLEERDGKIYVIMNGEAWLVQMHPDSFNAPSPDQQTISRRLGLSREINGTFQHVYIRRDEFFRNYIWSGQPVYEIDTANIARAIEEAKANASQNAQHGEDLRAFDISRDRPVGYIAMISQERDDVLNAGSPLQYAQAFPEALKSRGYDIRLPDGKPYIETADPGPALRESLQHMYDSGTRVFYIDLIGHGKRNEGVVFRGEGAPPLSPEAQKRLQAIGAEMKRLQRRLSTAEGSEKESITKHLADMMDEQGALLADATSFSAEEIIAIINDMLKRDPSCKFIVASQTCYGGGYMEGFRREARDNSTFKDNVALFLEAKGYQPGIPARLSDSQGNTVDALSYYRVALIEALRTAPTFGAAVAIADRETGRFAEADPESLIGGNIIR